MIIKIDTNNFKDISISAVIAFAVIAIAPSILKIIFWLGDCYNQWWHLWLD